MWPQPLKLQLPPDICLVVELSFVSGYLLFDWSLAQFFFVFVDSMLPRQTQQRVQWASLKASRFISSPQFISLQMGRRVVDFSRVKIIHHRVKLSTNKCSLTSLLPHVRAGIGPPEAGLWTRWIRLSQHHLTDVPVGVESQGKTGGQR